MFDVGSLESRLELDRTPFLAGLRAARMEGQRFERERYTATVNVDVDDAAAKARLDRLAADDKTIHGNVDLDIGAAEAKIALLKRQAAGIGGGIGGGVGGTGGGGSFIGPGSGPLSFLINHPLLSGLGLGAPFLPTIGASAVQGTLGAGALGLGLGGAGAVGGAGIIATAIPAVKGLSGALEAYSLQQKQAGVNAIQMAQQQSQAAAAQTAAAAQVQNAEEALGNAQKQETYAQQALTQARFNAVRQLTDMRRAALESVTAEHQAQLNLEMARRALAQAPRSTSALELEQLRLSVTEAKQARRDAEIQGQRQREDFHKAQRQGIAQMPEVVAAERQVEASHQGVADAARGLNQAEQAQTEQMKQARLQAEALAASNDHLSYAMSKLPPAGQEVFHMLIGLKDQWRELSMPAQTQFFGLLSDGIHTAQHELPMFAHSAEESMGAARGAADHFFNSLEGHDFNVFVNEMTDLFVKGVGPTEAGLENIAHVLGRIAVAVAPDVLHMLEGFASTTHQWEQDTRNAADLQYHVHRTVEEFGAWYDLTKSLGHLLAALFITNEQGARRGGQEVEAVSHQLDQWARWIDHHHHDISHFFARFNDDIGLLLSSAGQIASVVLPAFRPVADIIHEIVTDLNSIKVGNVSALTVVLGAMTARSLGGRLGLGGAPVPVGGGGGAGARGFGRGSGPLAALVGGAAVLQHFRHAQQAVEDDSVSFGDKVKTVYEDAFPPIKTEVDLATKALDALGGGEDTAAHKLYELAQNTIGAGHALHRLSGGIEDFRNKSFLDAIDAMKDHYGTMTSAFAHMSGNQRRQWEALAFAAKENGDITVAQYRHITGVIDNSTEKWQQQMRKAADVTGQTTNQIANAVGDSAVRVSRTYRGMVQVVGGGLNWLTSNTSRAAQAMGIKEDIKFHADPAAMHGAGGAGIRAGAALGGFIPGYSTTDNFPIAVRGGEAILRPEDHVPIVSQALQHTYGFGLGDLFNRTGAKVKGYSDGGYVDVWGKGLQHFAKGGVVPPPGGWSGMHPEIIALAQRMVRNFGGFLSSGLRPGDPGFHGRGMAVDWVGGDWGGGSRYANQIGSQLLEGIHQGPPGSNVSWDSGHQVSPSFWGAETWAAHVSHIHLAVSQAVKAAAEQVRRLILHPHIAMGDPGQGALDTTWHAANAFLRRNRPSVTDRAITAHGAGILSTPEFLGIANRAIGVTHHRDFTASGLLSLAMQESGLRVNPPPPHDINWQQGNPSMGLMQVTGSTFSAYHEPGTSRNIVDPLANIAASINYQAARYGHQVTTSPYGDGGHLRAGELGIVGERGVAELVAGRHDGGADVISPGTLRKLQGGRPIVIRPIIHVHVAPGSGAGMLDDRIIARTEEVLAEFGDLDGALARAR